LWKPLRKSEAHGTLAAFSVVFQRLIWLLSSNLLALFAFLTRYCREDYKRIATKQGELEKAGTIVIRLTNCVGVPNEIMMLPNGTRTHRLIQS
jgi:hypothetical protein